MYINFQIRNGLGKTVRLTIMTMRIFSCKWEKFEAPRSINCLFEDGKKSSLAAVRNGDLDRAKTFSTQDNEKITR